MRRVVIPVVVIAALAAVWGVVDRDSGAAGPPGSASVVSVTDGDTLRVRVGGSDERVRLLGIDTPETHGRGGLRECFGREATERTKALLPRGTKVRLVRDVEARDRYGRLLVYLYRANDDLFVNLELVEQGFAAAYTYPPNIAHADELVAAARRAREAGRGLWGRCGSPDVALD